ncbi:MAG: 4Fe-4S dicluster domain-containing protein [Candidatus Bathyarchaeota archaeon]|nr:4Fe-4S dicluster domain-containing protein [Candidatus Bathyarchaeota archaeon]
MPKAIIDPDKCQRCEECLASRACPVKAIFRIDAREAAVVEVKFCHGCGDCLSKCPATAITLKES